MNDVEHLKVKKEFAWNVGLYLVALAMLLVGWQLGLILLSKNLTVPQSLQVMALSTTFPAFLLIVAWKRISQETIGVILAALVGFAFGKFV
jgi:hypothetical protein